MCGQYRAAGGPSDPRPKRRRLITYGFSKDHRPDLKQLLFILTVERRERRTGAFARAPTATPATRAPTSRPGRRCARWRAAPTSCTWPTASCVRTTNMQHIHARRRALRHRDAALAPGRRAVSQMDPDQRPGLGTRLGSAQSALQRGPARLLVRPSGRSCPPTEVLADRLGLEHAAHAAPAAPAAQSEHRRRDRRAQQLHQRLASARARLRGAAEIDLQSRR
ncbi:MAG: hypothetical protein MZW92_16540 [Comamonadaceae bacterium]|nr:hypothetical protein [Comamonadaceae bacterium]